MEIKIYKGYGTILVTGKPGSGKTTFLIKYLKEIINNEDSLFYIIDKTNTDFYDYKENKNVIYVLDIDLFDELVYGDIHKDKTSKKKYLFINDYSEFKVKEEYHKKVKNLLYNRKNYNLDLA